MRRLLAAVVSRPTLVVLLVGSTLWGGAWAALHLPVGLFPGLDVPVVNVVTHVPGAGAEDVALLVTRPIEDRVRTIPGLRRVASTSSEGVSRITAEFAWGTRLADARQLVQAEVAAVAPDLPAGVRPRLENIGTTLEEVAGYVVYGADDPVALRTAVQSDLATRILGVDGVARVEVLGGDEEAYVASVRPADLARARRTLGDVVAAIASSNLAAAAGPIERGGAEYPVREAARLETLADLGDVPVAGDGPGTVPLREVATVHAGRVPRRVRIDGDGRPAVAFVVSKQPTASTTRVVPDVDRALEGARGLLPAGAVVRKYYDQSDVVTRARDGLLHDLLLGAILAAAVLWLLSGSLRATAIVAATIPVSLLATLALLAAFGEGIDVVTLSALTLAVGLVVDDAIVVAESILLHLRATPDARAASVDGAAAVAAPDASGTFTTAAAFAPLLFLGGIAGLFARPFGLTVSIALLASLVVSLSFVPAAFGAFGRPTERRAPAAAALARLDRVLLRALAFGVSRRRVALAIAAAALALGGVAAALGPARVLPAFDEGALLIEYVLPPGTSLDESDRVGAILERLALADPDVRTAYRRTGSPESGYEVEGVNRGELTLALAPPAERRRSASQILATLRRAYGAIPGIVVLYHQPTQEKMDESLSGLPATFGVTVFGSDPARLAAIAGEVDRAMARDPALHGIVDNTRIPAPQVVVRPDRAELARVGLAPRDVFDAIRAYRFGIPAASVARERRRIGVIVDLENDAAPTIEGLRALAIPTARGERVPLSRVAEVRIERAPAVVTRLDGRREVTILAEVDGSPGAAVSRLERAFAAIDLPPGYSIAFTGQYAVLARTARDFALVALAAVGLIGVILTLQLGSWRQALAILATVPFALVGAVVLLAVTHVGLDVTVGLGALTLVGIAVNNAIVLVDFANREAAAGVPIARALERAVSIRLRPIVMTAATTLLALLPVAIGPSIGSRMFRPFAVTVVGGLSSATAATLLLVPLLVLVVERRAQRQAASNGSTPNAAT